MTTYIIIKGVDPDASVGLVGERHQRDLSLRDLGSWLLQKLS